MNLTKDDIGKTIRRKSSSTRHKLLWVNGDYIWVTTEYSIGGEIKDNDDSWITEEAKKKPSERIKEKLAGTIIPCDRQGGEIVPSSESVYSKRLFEAVIGFLDEEFEKKSE